MLRGKEDLQQLFVCSERLRGSRTGKALTWAHLSWQTRVEMLSYPRLLIAPFITLPWPWSSSEVFKKLELPFSRDHKPWNTRGRCSLMLLGAELARSQQETQPWSSSRLCGSGGLSGAGQDRRRTRI